MDEATVKQNWWEDFFYGVALDFWRAVITPEQTRAEADFIARHLNVSAGARVLDVPCGNGRLSIELAVRGFRMHGVDIASEFIEEARRTASDRGVDVDWTNGDMRHLPWSEFFEGAFCFGNSFGYLEDDGNAAFLEAVGRALRPRSKFIIDSGAIAESLFPVFQAQQRMEIGDITLLAESRYDHQMGRLFTEYTFVRDGREDKRPSSQRVYTYREITALLKQSGFSVLDAFSSVADEPYKFGAPRLLLIASKT